MVIGRHCVHKYFGGWEKKDWEWGLGDGDYIRLLVLRGPGGGFF
jgi:hypothetical protein